MIFRLLRSKDGLIQLIVYIFLYYSQCTKHVCGYLLLCTLSKTLSPILSYSILSCPALLYPIAALYIQSPLTNRSVFGLPGVEVEQGRERLAQYREGDPEDAVADQLAGGTLHLRQRLRDGDQGELQQHAQSRDAWKSLLCQPRKFLPFI